ILAMGDLGYDFAAHSNIVLFAVHNSANPGATVSSPISIPVPPYEIPINPPQPGGVDNLDDGDGRLSASVYRVGDVLYGVHGVQFNNHAAIQWFLVSASTGSPLGSGRISHPTLHYFYPSIAANADGTVVIVFNACGTNAFISSYAVVGESFNGVLSFNDP